MKVEYRIVDEIESYSQVDCTWGLDELGQEGWILCAVKPSDKTVGKFVFYFYRVITPDGN